MAQVQIHHVAARGGNGTACFPFVIERLRQAVARPQFHVFVFRLTHRRFRAEAVILQVAVAVFIHQNTALAATTFGHQNARAGQAGGVVLHKFHIAQRHAVAVGHRHAVAGYDAAVGVEGKHAPGAAGGNNHALGLHRARYAVLQVVTQHALQPAVVHQQIQREMFVQTLNIRVLQRGLKQRVQHVEAGFIRRKPGARNLHAAETAHIGAPVGQPRPRAAPMLELNHFFGGVFDKILHHILLAQPVAAGNRVVEMVFQRIVVAHHPGRTAFGGHGMAAHRVHLGNQVYGFIRRGAGDFDCRPQTGSAGADNRYIGVDNFHFCAFSVIKISGC